MHRRDFIRTLAVGSAGALAGLEPNAIEAAESPTARRRKGDLVDTNVSLSRWPFRRVPLDETKKLVTKLKGAGISEAWAGSFDALLHKNLGAVNESLADECRKHGHGALLPFGTVNPKLPDWQEETLRCQEKHEMLGLRLFPNYHGYKLNDPDFLKLLAEAESRGLIVQVAMSMEDERMQHSLVRVPNVDPGPLAEIAQRFPKLKLVLLNWFRSVKGETLTKLGKNQRIWFDIAMVEEVGGISKLLREIPADRIVFGSHAPFYYLESALLKLKESALNRKQTNLIERGSAAQILAA
jgi:predicted TIM-barrel fold metal-dependent hydrolase